MRFALLGVVAACSFEQRSVIDAGVTRDTPTPPGDTFGACVDRLEPNDTGETASEVSFEEGTFVADGLSICPSSDTDTFRIEIGGVNQAIEAILMVLAGDGTSIDFVVQNENGGTIAIAENLGGVNYIICAPNLPPGVYFLEISEATDAVYRLSVAGPGMGGMCN